uniref:Uncharacterized protein n=1 Tax=Rhizophora mucronata TaxID=61149 RepID=A0A2P2NYR0_RHIMU
MVSATSISVLHFQCHIASLDYFVIYQCWVTEQRDIALCLY